MHIFFALVKNPHLIIFMAAYFGLFSCVFLNLCLSSYTLNTNFLTDFPVSKYSENILFKLLDTNTEFVLWTNT